MGMVILSLIGVYLDYYIFKSFFSMGFEHRQTKRKSCWYYRFKDLFYWVVYALGVFTLRLLEYSRVYLFIYMIIFCFVLSVRFVMSIKQRFFYICLLALIKSTTEYITYDFFVKAEPLFFEHLIANTTADISFFLIIKLMIALRLQKTNPVHMQQFVIVTLIPVVSLIIFIMMNSLGDNMAHQKHITALVFGGILLLNLMVFMIHDFISFQHNEIYSTQIEMNRIEIEKNVYHERYNRSKELAAFAHDSMKHLRVVSTLLQEQRIEESLAYIKELDTHFEQVAKPKKYLELNHPVNAVLQDKISEAHKKGITVYYDIYSPLRIPIKEYRFMRHNRQCPRQCYRSGA